MHRRKFLYLTGGLAGLAMQPATNVILFREAANKQIQHDVLGMYVHEGWPYNHPYAARTWTVEDWRGYADGLSKLGYNTLVIWPALEIMPEPLTPSDHAQLNKIADVINILHREFGFLVFLTLCPNLLADQKLAARYTFERRPLFSSVKFVDPSDVHAMRRLIDWRQRLLRPLAQMDGIAIIDSDPGGFPGSTNAEFVTLLADHRNMLDQIRPGIELYYWMHVGWEAYSLYYATGHFRWGTPPEAEDVLRKLKNIDPRPWGITIHTLDPPPNGTDLKLAEKFGVASTSLAFNYGAIEGEPEFPLTNFGGDAAFKAGGAGAPHGVVGNAQSHCLQLPNSFAFARGAKRQPVAEADYTQFANGLIEGNADLIVTSWRAIAGSDPRLMRSVADELDAVLNDTLRPGPLKGLLFGNPRRFMADLMYQLRMKSAYLDFVTSSRNNVDRETFRAFLVGTQRWQHQHGFQAAWPSIWQGGNWAGLGETLKKLESPSIDRILAETSWLADINNWAITSQQAGGSTSFERVQNLYHKWDTNTLRLISAMQETLEKTSSR